MNKNKKRLKTGLLYALTFMVASSALAAPIVFRASTTALSLGELRERTEKLEKQIASADKEASKLHQRGNSLKEEIALLDTKIAAANAKIDLTNAKIEELQKQLDATQKELDRQKDLLRASMRALYVRGDASTIELLIGSDTFSAFIDEQEYLERLKLGIQDSTNKVIELKHKIEGQQTEQLALKDQLEAQRELVRKARSDQEVLLAETQGQESRYKAHSAKLQKQQAELLAQIVSRSRVITGVGTGSYPWANYRGNSWSHAESCSYGDDIDPWGYCYRQCVSFAAWRLYSAGKTPPKNYGNAENWDDEARADGKKTGHTPREGAIAVWNGFEGHVAYVEEVLGDGTVRISEYNAVPALAGKYSQRIINASDPAAYIYF